MNEKRNKKILLSRKKIFKQKTPSQAVFAITSGQIARIESLEADIQSLISKLNSPIAIISTLAIFMIFFESFIHNYLRMYDKEYNDTFDQLDFIGKNVVKFGPIFTRHHEAFKSFLPDLLMQSAAAISQQKIDFLRFYYDIINLPPSRYFLFKEIPLDELHSMSRDELYQINVDQIKHILSHFSVPAVTEKQIFLIAAKLDLIKEMLPKIIPASIIIRQVFLRSAINRLFPDSFLKLKHPKKKSLLLTQSSANKFIDELEQHQLSLRNKNQTINKIYGYSLFSMFLLLLVFFAVRNEDELPSPFFFYCLFCFTEVSISELYQKLSDVYHNKRLENTLQNQENILKNLINNHCELLELEKIKGTTLKSSYFSLTFPNKKLTRIFADCCYFFKIKIVGREYSCLTLPSQPGINQQNISSLLKLFNDSIKRHETFPILKKQIEKIVEAIGIQNAHSLIKPDYDKNGLPIISVENLMLPSQDKEAFQACFGLNENTIEVNEINDDHYIHIDLSGAFPADYDQFYNLLNSFLEKKIPSFRKDFTTSFFNQDYQYSQRNVPQKPERRDKEKKEKGKERSIKPTSSEISKKERYIQWRNGKYFFKSSKSTYEGNVHPILSGSQFDNYDKTRLFITNGVPKEHVPSDMRNIWKHVNHIICERSEFVSKKGQSGIIFCNQNTGRGRTCAKIKFFGEHGVGDARAYALEENVQESATGEKLYIVTEICPHTHKSHK